MQDDILTLIKGHQKFREVYFNNENSTFTELVAEGQRPKILIVACSDSRVDPALVLNCQPGDLFVIRNVANLVPPFEEDLSSYHGTSAALEFGVCVLKVAHVILFGHTQCGGIQNLLDHPPEAHPSKGFLTKWMELAKPARDTTIKRHPENHFEEKTTLCGQYSLMNSLKNLKTFPWIQERVNDGSLHLHAWNFNMAQGTLEQYDEDQNRFKVIPHS